MSDLVTLFQKLDYGPAPESDQPAQQWLESHHRSFGFYLNYIRKYLNAVYFKSGIQLPFDSKEIYTSVAFKEMAMHIFLDLEDEADRFFEDEFWDEEAKQTLER